MLAGIGLFAIESAGIPPWDGETEATNRTVNAGVLAAGTIQTPGGRVTYEGTARTDGVPGISAPVTLNFRDIAGSVCGALLSTGNVVDKIDGVPVTR